MTPFFPTGGDDTAAFQATLNGLTVGGGKVTFRGLLKYTALTVPDGVWVDGEGTYASVLQCLSLTGDSIALGHDARLSNLKCIATGQRTAGATIRINGNGVLVDDVDMGNYHVGISVGPGAIVIDPTIRGCTFRDPSLTAGGAAIVGCNYGNLVIDDVLATGPQAGTQPSAGIRLLNGDTCLIEKTNITLHGAALKIEPAAGQSVYATKIIGSLFDWGIGHSSAEITPAGQVRSTVAVASWFGGSDKYGAVLEPSNGGLIDDFKFVGCEFPNNACGQIKVGGNVRGLSCA